MAARSQRIGREIMNIGSVAVHLLMVDCCVFLYFAGTLQLIPALICVGIGIVLAFFSNVDKWIF